MNTYRTYLKDCSRRYSCVHCRTHLASQEELISKKYLCNNRQAYLFTRAVNVVCLPATLHVMHTGYYIVSDIFCTNCKMTVGFKYVHSKQSRYRFKEGKFVIEMHHMVKENRWDE